MLVWRTNLKMLGTKPADLECGSCRAKIRYEDEYCEVHVSADERVRVRPLIRCAACGHRMIEADARAKEAKEEEARQKAAQEQP